VPSTHLSLTGHSRAIAIGSSFLFFIGNYLSGWPLLRYWNVSGGVFPDSEDILLMGECFGERGLEIYSTAQVDDCHGYWYGSMLVRALDFFRIGSELNIVVGFLFFLLLSYSLVTVVWSSVTLEKYRVYVLVGFLLSPPVLLLAHRGNFDSLIILLIIGSIFQIQRGNLFFANTLIISSAFLKFYTAPLLLLTLLMSDRPRKFFLLLVADLATAIVLLGDLSRVTHFWNGDSFKQMFGLGALTGAVNETMTFQISGSLAKNLDLGLLIFALLCLGLTRRRWRIALPEEFQGNFKLLGFLLFGSVSVVSFMLGSVDYRLIFLVFSILFLISIYEFAVGEIFFLSFLSIFAVMLSFPSGKMNIYGDAAALTINAIILFFLVPLLLNLARLFFSRVRIYLQNLSSKVTS
jgi:hypothetical protein